jgi:PAS domain S-box-containing protein
MSDYDQLVRIANRIERINEEIQLHAAQGNEELNYYSKKLEVIERELKDLLQNFLDFRTISDSLYDGIYISDGQGKTLFVNKAYSRLTGIKKEQVIGRTVKEVSDEGKLYKGAVTMKVLEKKEQVSSIGVSLVNNREHLVTGTPIFDEEGNVRLVVINNRNITELHELESQMLKMEYHQKKADEEIKFLRKQLSSKAFSSINKEMQSLIDLVDAVAPTDVTVLITGESGTGKEVIADEIYSRSSRNQKPFIKLNCAAIPSELLESELFGYERGAFTDAKKSGKVGIFELANEGTILLDEIGDMPMKLQTKLLRVLQERQITRLGGSTPIDLDIRLIAATNKDLIKEIETGRFREDLFYRINVVPIHIKPLRERQDDIGHLAQEFIGKYGKKYNKEIKTDRTFSESLKQYSWPGNIRELENLIERMVVINQDGVLKSENVENLLYLDDRMKPMAVDQKKTLKSAVRAYEKRIIKEALENHGSVNKAAKYLGISQPALWKKCKNLEINS